MAAGVGTRGLEQKIMHFLFGQEELGEKSGHICDGGSESGQRVALLRKSKDMWLLGMTV